MSAAPPTVCANTRPGGSSLLATKAMAGVPSSRHLLSKEFREIDIAIGKHTHHDLPPILFWHVLHICLRHQLGELLQRIVFLFAQLLCSLRALLRICSGTSQSFAENSAAASLRAPCNLAAPCALRDRRRRTPLAFPAAPFRFYEE